MLKEGSCVDSYYDYICIIDFEATCEEGNPPEFIHEIIEFPVVLLNTHTLEIVSELLYFSFILSSNSPGVLSRAGISFAILKLEWEF